MNQVQRAQTMKASPCVLFFLWVSGCATAQVINRPKGLTAYLISCGAGTGWDIYYNKANEVCSQGYKTLSEEAGFNRKKIKIVYT